jgi:hypothetical protein
MSYRELRNFKEIMCALGYPRLISIENFKVPHFELVADILVWLCHRYDKNMEVLDEIRTEHDRVAFLKSVAEQLLVKVRAQYYPAQAAHQPPLCNIVLPCDARLGSSSLSLSLSPRRHRRVRL